MEVFLYLLDMNMDLQFILSSCGCIGNKCMVGVGLPLPRRTKSFVPVLYMPQGRHPDHNSPHLGLPFQSTLPC